MKPQQMAMLAGLVCLALAGGARAQIGMDYFKKPAIADIFRPVVGTGAVYETEHGQKKDPVEMSVVGKDTVDGKEAYRLEFGHTDQKTGVMSYGKMLVTKDDFQFHRMIIQPPGQPQPMEIPMNPSMRRQSQVQEAMEKWHKVGTETITVPAGTFSCDHWTKDDGKGDVWASSKISPMGMVKETSPDHTMVLIKVLTEAKDHITGTPTKFDPEEMKRQMMEKMQQQKQQPRP